MGAIIESLSGARKEPTSQKPVSVVEFPLGSDQAIDGLIQYFDQLRVDNLPVEVKFDPNCPTPGAVRVQFPLPIGAIAQSIDLKALNGIVITSQQQK